MKTVSETPGAGGSYTAITPLWGTIPSANNPFDQAVNQALGATLSVAPANPTDAHPPLGEEHDLAASLCHAETRQVANDYTIRFRGKIYQIARRDVKSGLRGNNVRVERRLDDSIAVCFRERYLTVEECRPRP